MENFSYTEPFIYPNLNKGNAKTGYKDRNNKPITKWFVKYTIIASDGSKISRKEYGNSYDIDLNRIKNLKNKIYEANLLCAYVADDLQNGIDPLNRKVAIAEQAQQLLRESEKYSMQYVFNQWFVSKNYVNPIPSKEISAIHYSRYFNYAFIPFLEKLEIADDIRKISDLHITQFIREKYDSGDWSAFTANIRIGWLGGVFKFAYKHKLIPVNPMNYVERILENKIITKKDGTQIIKFKSDARTSIFTDLEIEQIFEGLYGTQSEAVAKTVFYSFLRFSEIYRLRIKDLDLDDGYFNVRPEIAKGQRDGRIHKVRIYPKLLEALKRYINSYFGSDMKPDYYLFYHIQKHHPASYSIFQHSFNQLKKDLKLKGIIITKPPYSLKHTGAKRFIDVNKSKNVKSYQIIEAIMKQMRHSDFSTTQRYIYKDLGLNLDEDDVFSFD
ncbi:site-specific integrase [Pedobacter frigidisoli]|uniref:tyrosine-type recombinase/integrase n=1 Tax=Pedobacter frigidisoli TaxID=2530455 RepID=UPI0029315DEF|nr:site-specific integrase [Pedobacter frigidisoli]